MDLSVFERQRSMFQRMHQHNHPWPQQPNDQTILHSLPDQHQLLARCWQPDHQVTSTSNNSSLTGVKVSKPEQQCNSSLASRKRKAEFDVEEMGCKNEAAEEQSEVTTKVERESSSITCSKGVSKASGPEKPDYIHVRARRGQATDSHSLAERARREKISKKMKCLQDLVPGCNKVTGKAGMLDEIINYVQSLQKQVEFLSMKLAALNPSVDVNIDSFLTKEILAYIAAAQFEATNTVGFPYGPMLQQGTSNCGPEAAIDQSQMLSQKPGPESFCDPTFITQLQQLSGWESDWPSQFNVGFH